MIGRLRYRRAVRARLAEWTAWRDAARQSAAANRRWASGYTRRQRAGAFARQVASYEAVAAEAKRRAERYDRAIARAERILESLR